MRKIKRNIIIFFSCLLVCFGGLFASPNFSVNASSTLFSGEMINNVIYVTFSDGDKDYFNDTPTNYSKSVHTLLDYSYNGSVSSVKNYYKAQSFNKLTITTKFYTNGGEAFNCGYTESQLKPYSLSNTEGYKESQQQGREQTALKNVLNQITSLSGNVDNNNDGNIDILTFIFPYSSGKDDIAWDDLLWSHQWELANTNSVTIGGKKARSYNLASLSKVITTDKITDANGQEIIKNFSLAHELGHVLGLPDYYAYNDDYYKAKTGTSDQSESMYYWDLMSYSYDGVPTYLTTYNREILGFTNSYNIVELTTEGTYTLYPTCYDEVNNNNENSNNVLAFVYKDKDYPNQKIYFEYRTKDGNFETGITNYGRKDGLIIYRVDTGIIQDSSYDDGLSQGNYKGIPYNMYMFRKSSEYLPISVLNNSNSNYNLITFQNYDSKKNQAVLTQSDVSYTGSNLNITNVKIENGKLSFKITGGELKSAKNVSTIKLSGNNSVNHEVNTTYVDAGIDYGNGGYVEDDFYITINNTVDTTELGSYTYKYTLTSKTNSEVVLSFTRTVCVVDTTPPTIELIGDSKIIVNNISNYVEPGVNCDDNYYKGSEIVHTEGPIEQISEKKYKRTYVVSAGGLSSEVVRYIIVLSKPTDFSSIVLNGNTAINHTVKENYTDLGITYGGEYNASQFDVKITDNVNKNKNTLGSYTYIYTLTFDETYEEYVLTRTVNVVDDVAPTIQLQGSSEITIRRAEILSYNDTNVLVADNYCESKNITVTTRLEQVSDTEYKFYYKAKDASGNESEEIYRTLKVLFIPLTENQIILKIGEKDNQNVYTTIDTKFTVEINYNEDNNQSDPVKVTILNNASKVYDTLQRQFTYKFTDVGLYNIKVNIGSTEKNIQLIVMDISEKPVERSTKALITCIIVVVIVITVFTIIIGGMKKQLKRMKRNLDRY